jgi:beta-lactamase superfamily II metal-dependent hydrolase
MIDKGTKVTLPRLHSQIRLSGALKMTFLWPEIGFDLVSRPQPGDTETQLSAYLGQKGTSQLSANDGSIALFLQYQHFSFLTTGDLEEHPEQTLVTRGVIKDIDVLKAGHHGSKTSSTATFLAAARPEFTLVSSGKNNRYGHPHTEVLRRLEEVGSQILRTDQLGHIELQTNGQDYWFFHSPTSSN